MSPAGSESLGSPDARLIRLISTHLVAALRHAVAGSPINGMRQLLKATDLAPRIEDIDTRCRAYELCRYCELAFVAHQHIRWSVQQNTQGEALHG